MSELNEKDLWDYADLQRLGYGCRTKIWKMLKEEGKFPQPIDDGNGNPRWIPTEVRKYFGNKAYTTTIPRNIRLAEAPSFGRPVLYYDRTSAGAQAYIDFAHEFVWKMTGAPPTTESASSEAHQQKEVMPVVSQGEK